MSESVSQILITMTGIAYFACGVDQYFKGGSGTAIMFFGYALSNIGIYLQAK